MQLILTEQQIPEHLKEFFEPLKTEFTSVLTVNTNKFRGKHFAPYPKNLVTPCILATCPEDGIVLDPFTGSGITGVVAMENKRNFIGIELVAGSADIARQQLEAVNKVLG